MVSYILTYSWQKFTGILLSTKCVVTCLHNSNTKVFHPERLKSLCKVLMWLLCTIHIHKFILFISYIIKFIVTIIYFNFVHVNLMYIWYSFVCAFLWGGWFTTETLRKVYFYGYVLTLCTYAHIWVYTWLQVQLSDWIMLNLCLILSKKSWKM